MSEADKKDLLDSLTRSQRLAIAQLIREAMPVWSMGDDGCNGYSVDDTLDAAAREFEQHENGGACGSRNCRASDACEDAAQ